MPATKKLRTLADVEDIANDLDICFNIYTQERYGKTETFIELEYWPDASREDCIATIFCETPAEFADELYDYIEDFDPEEFESPFLEMSKAERDKYGCPGVMAMLEGAQEFCDALTELQRAVVDRLRIQEGMNNGHYQKRRMPERASRPCPQKARDHRRGQP